MAIYAKRVSLSLLCLMAACSPYVNADYEDSMSLSERPFLLRGLPQGDSPYAMGFRSGCANQVSYSGNVQQRLIADMPIPPEMITNKLYIAGYKNGGAYCGVYVNAAIIQ